MDFLGLYSGDFREALAILLGKDAVLSPSSVMRLKEKWFEQYLRFHNHTLDTHYAYVYADDIYLNVGLVRKSLALLAVIGVNEHRQKFSSWLSGES